MRVISGHSMPDILLKMYAAVFAVAETSARGSCTRNVHNMAVVMPANVPPVTSFAARNFNLAYAKREWLWYLGADKYDSSIEKYATMWKKLKQPDGSYYSNYGHYIFDIENADGMDQFTYVIRTLLKDRNSRRASIMLLRQDHLFESNIDTVCTYAINFTIEGKELHMTVMMRSNDVIFGFTNDAFCFWNLYQFVYEALRPFYPDLSTGIYTHFANSMHVYDRHYDMIRSILHDSEKGYTPIDIPRPTLTEVHSLINSQGRDGHGQYTEWLKA